MADAQPDRRDFLATVSSLAMAGGLAASYGTFAVMAGRFLYPAGSGTAWMFLMPDDQLAPGESFAFRSPAGENILVTRRAAPAEAAPAEAVQGEDSPIAGAGEISEGEEIQPNISASDFLALSSVCPHLGCRVHWESQNDRFFCPCHNGSFNAKGEPLQGPPKAANQSLPRYTLKWEQGIVYIELPVEGIGGPSDKQS